MTDKQTCIVVVAVIALPVVLAALGVTVAWAIWDARVSARLEKRLDAIRAAGDPVTMAELAELYPPLPPDRNAAPI